MLKRFSFNTRTRRSSTTTSDHNNNNNNPIVNNNNNNAIPPTSPLNQPLPDSDALQTAISKKMSEIMDEKVRTSVRLHKEAVHKSDENVMLAQQVRTLKEQLGRQSTLLLDQESIELAKSRESLYQRIQAPPNFWVDSQQDCPDTFFDPTIAFYAAESSRTTSLANAMKQFFEETSGQDISQTPQRTSLLTRQARGNTEVAKLLSVARGLSFSVVDFHDTSGYALYGGVRPSITLTFCGLVPTIQHAVGFIQWSNSVSSWSSENSSSLGGLLLVMCAALENQEQRQFIYGALVDLDSVQIYKMEKLDIDGAFKTTAYAQTPFHTSKRNGRSPLARMLLTDPETLGLEISLPLQTKPPPSALTWLKSFRQAKSSAGGGTGRDALSEEKEEEEEDDEIDDTSRHVHANNKDQPKTSPKPSQQKTTGVLIDDLDISPPNLAPLAILQDSAFFAIANHPDYVIKTFRTVDCIEMRREIQALEMLRDLNLAQVFECVPALLDIGPNFVLLSSMDRIARFDGNTSFHLLRGPLLALKHAHSLGIIHRCIAPENLLIANNSSRIFIANWNWSGFISESIRINIGPGLRFASDDILLASLHDAETTFSPRDDVVSLARVAAWSCDLSRQGTGQGELPSIKAGAHDIMKFWSRALVSFGISELCATANRCQYEEMAKLLERVRLSDVVGG